MKNVTGRIYRSSKSGKNRYTPIFNDLLQNTELSFRARGLLVYILSLPLDWVPVKSQIMKKNNYKRTKFDAIWNELKEAGYIHSKRVKNDLGQYVGWDHLVLETPTFVNSDIQENLHSEKNTLTKDRDITKDTVRQKKELYKDLDNTSTESTGEVTMGKSFKELFYSNPNSVDVHQFLNLN